MSEVSDDVLGLVKAVVVPLVDFPDDVSVALDLEQDDLIVVNLQVNEEDAGKVIGRQGRVIKSIRTLARAAASRSGARVEGGAARLVRDWVQVAYLAKARQLQGGLVARKAAGLPFALSEGLSVRFVPPALDGPRGGTVSSVAPLDDESFLVFFDTVSSVDEAQRIAGSFCLALRDDVADNVLARDGAGLEGCLVVDGRLGLLGRVREVRPMPAQPLIVVERDGRPELLVPFVDEIVTAADPAAGRIDVRLPDGLADL